MEEVLTRFPTIGQEIFKLLDDKSLAKSRETSKIWCLFLDNDSLLWQRRILKFSKYQIEFNEAWKMVTSNVSVKFLKKLALALEKYYKTYPLELQHEVSPLHLSAMCGNVDLIKQIFKRISVLCFSRVNKAYNKKKSNFTTNKKY